MLSSKNKVFIRGLFAAGATAAAVFSAPANAALPIESWTAASGAKVMFMRAEALPMLDVRVDFPRAAAQTPRAKRAWPVQPVT